jgi:pectate lyase
MGKIYVILSCLLFSTGIFAQSVTINSYAGWLESAYVKWQPIDSAKSYNVYYSGGGYTDQQISNMLIRSYGTYYRADIPGLAAGTYTIKIVPVFTKVTGDAATTGTITVLANDRAGFAFANGRVPGAYKSNGTPKDNAVIVYVTNNNKDSVSLNVTGASSNPCVGLQTILDGFKKGKDTRPLIVRLIGQITDLSYMLDGDLVIEDNNNASCYITMEGVGADATADGWGIRVKNASNIEIRNIGIMNCNSGEGDNIGLQQDNDYIWVHNCDYFYGDAGSDPDQVKGDGALDCKKSTYVTFSYNHFWDNGKCNLLGLSDESTTGYYITYHHNWYDHSDSRHPRVRFYSAHVYNNYYDGNAKYGAGSTMGSSVFEEANYFRNCKYPMLISMQGSDVYDESTGANDYTDMPTFSKEDGGIIKAYNNYMTGQHRFVPYGSSSYTNSTVDFDAYVATTRDETVSSSVVSYKGSNTYNNFDTNSSLMYSYNVDSPEDAKTNVTTYAGRVEGGDFKWTFDNSVDDASYAVNTALKTALTSYTTSLVSVLGDTTSSSGGSGGSGSTDTTSTDTTTVVSDVIHNFTLSGISSTFFTISGSLSTSYGSVTYSDLTLTQCLKIESSTSISFTLTKSATYTLVFLSSFTGSIYINGTAYTATGGIITVTLSAGTYTVTKKDKAYLFYMSITYSTTTGVSEVKNKEVKIHPVPVTNTMNITTDNEIQKIEIYNLTGVKVKSFTGNDKSVEIGDLTEGSYIVNVITNKGTFRQTILKK